MGLLEELGGETGCRRLSAEFYARVGKDPVLKPLFPGKSLRCATEEFSAFLVQFLGGDEEQAQARWWLSLRESHARFRIGAAERSAWLKHMTATLEEAAIGERARGALRQFFMQSSAYVIGGDCGGVEDTELAERWQAQRALDAAIGAIAAGRDAEAIALARQFEPRPSVFTGLLARMARTGREEPIRFVMGAVEKAPSLAGRRFAGWTLLHFAAGAGCVEVVELLLRLGADPNVEDRGGHTPLYSAANECGSGQGPLVVEALVRAGADVNACGGVTRGTALHAAARRGHAAIARALLERGADAGRRDRKGDTPLERAVHCRRVEVARVLGRREP
jgi:truncated hemoglobin YjbI